jgi:type IV pilus assembly protein PilA
MDKDRKKVKGFTLVELIVVMLILAILAGMFIPSLVGYIDKANESALQIQTRQLYQAAQVIATENYKNGGFSCNALDMSTASESTDKKVKEFAKLAEVNTGTVTVECDGNGKISQIIYSDGDKSCTLNVASRNGFEVVSNE